MATGDLDYYTVLGLSPTAGQDEIRAAYRRLVKQRHPDHGGTAEMFRLLQAAYETLIDPIERARYDTQLAEGIDPEPDLGATSGYDFSQLVGQPAAPTVQYLESAGIYPHIRMQAVTDPRLDGIVIAVDEATGADSGAVTLTVGVTERTASWLAKLGYIALQTAWQMTKRGALVAKTVADTGMKELDAVRSAGPGYQIPRPWQPRGCMTRIYVVFALLVVLIIAVPVGAKFALIVVVGLLLSPFAIAVAVHRAARRKFYRQ